MAGILERSVITTKGLALQAKAAAGLCQIAFTRAASGSGLYTNSEDLTNRTALKSRKQYHSIQQVGMTDATSAFARFTIDNTSVNTGYDVTEIGIYATDPYVGEILYAIAVSADGEHDYLPAYDGTVPAKITINFIVGVGNASAVNLVAPADLYLYDDVTGVRYTLGISNGRLYFEEA